MQNTQKLLRNVAYWPTVYMLTPLTAPTVSNTSKTTKTVDDITRRRSYNFFIGPNFFLFSTCYSLCRRQHVYKLPVSIFIFDSADLSMPVLR